MHRIPAKGFALFESSQVSPACPTDKSSIKMKMITEHWWNDTDRGNPKYWEKPLLICHFELPKISYGLLY